MTKICAQQQKQSQILSIELLKQLSEFTKSGFFATQTLCQIIERDQALYPQALRALGCLSQTTSRPEIEKLVNRAFLDYSRKRNVAAAVLAAHHQNIQIPLQNVERVLGPPGYLAIQRYDEGTIQSLSAKYNALTNPYMRVAIIEKLSQIQNLEDRKKLQKFLSFLPQNKKDLSISNLAPYLEAFKAISNLQFDAIKPYLSQIFNSFSIIFDLVKQPHVQIAFLRQILKVHQTAVSENVSVSDLKALNEVLDRNQHNHNQTIATLCSMNLIMSTYDMDAIMKLVDMLPNLTQDLKHNALVLLSGLAAHERLYSNTIPMYKRFLQSPDVDMKSCGIKALSEILQHTQDQKLRSTLASVVLSNLDAAGADSELRSLLCSQLAHLDVDNYDEAVEIAASLWQRCMIDGIEMRIASVQALYGLTKKFTDLNPIIEKVLQLQSDVFVKNALIERDEEIISKHVDKLKEFNPDDIIANTKNIIKNNYSAITFTKKVQNNSQKAEQIKIHQEAKAQEIQKLIQLNPNYKDFKLIFTNAQPTVLTTVQYDFVLEVYKVYFFNQANDSNDESGEILYYFKTYTEEDVEFKDQKLKIDGTSHKFTNGELVYIQKFQSVGEAFLKSIRFYYTLDGLRNNMFIEDIHTQIIDLTSSQFSGNMAEYFASQEQNKIKIKEQFTSVEEVIDTYQMRLGLSMDNLKTDGKKIEFMLGGHIYGSGKVVCKFSCTPVEGKGIKLRVDCRGDAAEVLISLLT